MTIEIRHKEYDKRYIIKNQKLYSSFTHLPDKTEFSPSVNYTIVSVYTKYSIPKLEGNGTIRNLKHGLQKL